jgi:hypothetical protein
MPVDALLIELKRKGDNTYRRFLNRYGDLTYSTFALADGAYLNAKGIYAHYAGTSCNTSDDAGIRRRSV